ncbi:hypothetical protein V7S43_015617 [Phytophthora oleae]
MAAVQLNVFYEGWEDDESCPLDTGYARPTEEISRTLCGIVYAHKPGGFGYWNTG